MAWFNRNKTAIITAETNTPIDTTPYIPPAEEWIWVEGYKGTNKDMKCRDFQYELNKQFDMPEDAKIEACSSGFHFSLTLTDVFDFYDIGFGNRFFKVEALVRKADYENYKNSGNNSTMRSYLYTSQPYSAAPRHNRKLAAKSIILTEEVSIDTVLKNTPVADCPDKYKVIAIETKIEVAIYRRRADTLIEDGYSEAFANYIIAQNKFDVAHAVGTQKDLSMDMKVLTIFIKEKDYER